MKKLQKGLQMMKTGLYSMCGISQLAYRKLAVPTELVVYMDRHHIKVVYGSKSDDETFASNRNCVGYYSPRKRIIAIRNLKSKNMDLKSKLHEEKSTFYHELGHFVDEINDSESQNNPYFNFVLKKEIMNWVREEYAANPEYIQYLDGKSGEIFAEGFSGFSLKSKLFQNRCPHANAYFQTLID